MTSRAVLIFREKLTDGDSNLTEAVLWRVPITPSYPEGIRYRLAWVRCGQTRPAVPYDNHSPKGHHRHVEDHEEAYALVDAGRLRDDFLRDVSRLRGRGQ